MAWSGLFKEAATAGKRELTVKREAYEEKDAVAIETWQDETLFKVRGLNHLRLSGFLNMKEMNPLVNQLNYLLELILTHNGLESLPEEVGSLTKLRLLDVSHNHIKLLPQGLYQLMSLQKLLLGNNKLTNDSFPSNDEEIPFPSLQHINIASNELTVLPQFVYKSPNLAELIAPYNDVEILSGDIGHMTALKTLEMTHNALLSLPHEMSQCTKLKTMLFEDNPLQDKRLVKILGQFGATKPKAVLDYLGSKAPKAVKGKGKKKKGGVATPQEDESGEDEVQVEFSQTKLTIRVVRPSQYVVVKSMNIARQIRPYLVCAVVRNLTLSEEDTYRMFITLQTKLHETVCKRRRLATIATHSLSSVTLPLTYNCRMAEKINFQPLGWSQVTTARQFLSYVNKNKPDQSRGGHKPYSIDMAAAQISKFLPMVDPTQMVHLVDNSGTVISLPPLTNSETSKITELTRDILIEVTSSTSLADAKTAMDTLLFSMIRIGLRSNSAPPILEASPLPPVATPLSTYQGPRELIVEQVKVVDEADKLLVMYPSRPDLVTDAPQDIEVLRPT